jgi:hypothetical protein
MSLFDVYESGNFIHIGRCGKQRCLRCQNRSANAARTARQSGKTACRRDVTDPMGTTLFSISAFRSRHANVAERRVD